MTLRFVKLSPTQNMTIIVEEPVPRADHGRVAGALMAYAGVYAEQAGFREPPMLSGVQARLQMMGGEFCGNAAMCLAACVARENGLGEGDETAFSIEMSGAAEPVGCRVRLSGGEYVCRVEIPPPWTLETRDGYALARLPGIAHAVIECEEPERLRAGAEDMLRRIAAEVSEEAVGLMLYAPRKSELLPLVYVKGTDSMVWERGCGSGSAAVGAYAAWRDGRGADLPLRQPGGVIRARAEWNGGLAGVSIEGCVRFVCEGVAYI